MAKLNLIELLNMDLFDENGDKCQIFEGFPKAAIFKPYKVNNTIEFHVPVGEKNMIIFHLIRTYRGIICISDYLFPERTTLICKSPDSIMEFYATISGKIDIHLENDQIRSANAGKYNLMTAPSVHNRAVLDGYIKTIDFHPDFEYIEKLATSFPVLKEFLKASRAGKILALHTEEGNMPFRAAFLYIDLIREVHENNISEDKRTTLIHTILELMITASSPNYAEMPFTFEKLMAISYVTNYVKTHLELNYTVADLQKLAIKFNALTYKEILSTFKVLYGKTPIAYIKELKMNKAKEYLDMHKTEATAAGRLGYRYLSHLERDFKAYHEITIKAYKQQQKKQTS